MSRSLQRIGDANSGGGIITSVPQSTVFLNGVAVAVDGSTGTSHPFRHNSWATRGTGGVYIGNRHISRAGDADTCGHVRVGGSSNCFSGG